MLLAAICIATIARAEVDPSLTHTQDWIASSNMTSATGADIQIKIDLARRQRDQHDYGQASKTLVSILDSDAPDGFRRTALLELALTAQQANQPARAEQVFGQYIDRFRDDPNLPEVLLRQGLLYRQMGAQGMALSKFYAVMTTILNLKLDSSGYYQRLVLQAQTEIAETYYLQGNYTEAANFFNRLLKLDTTDLNKSEIRLKLLHCLEAAGEHEEAVRGAQELLAANPADAEARFLLALSLQRLGRKQESLRQVALLLQSPEGKIWKKSVGNEIANQLYSEGDYANALAIYGDLSQIDSSPGWQVPVLYQIGLTYERLQQREQAVAAFSQAVQHGAALDDKADPGLRVVLDMAAWRKNYLAWQIQALQDSQAIQPPPVPGKAP